MRIWDNFLIEGWKGFFKCCLAILDIHKEKLLKMRFDTILSFINEIARDEFFTNFNYHQHMEAQKAGKFVEKELLDNDRPVRDFQKSVQKFSITKDLLNLLSEDHVRIDGEAKENKRLTTRRGSDK
jgi:hypothetical protein